MSTKERLAEAIAELPDTLTIEEAVERLYRAFRAKKESIAERRRAALGIDAGKMWVADDFDAPLPPEVLRLFEGGAVAP